MAKSATRNVLTSLIHCLVAGVQLFHLICFAPSGPGFHFFTAYWTVYIMDMTQYTGAWATVVARATNFLQKPELP
jgi:cytochrome b